MQVAGLFDLTRQLEDFQPDLIISITDGGPSRIKADALLEGAPARVLRIDFHDVDQITPGIIAPSLPAFLGLRDALLAMSPLPSRVLTHCHAGISRSPATAMVAAGLIVSAQANKQAHVQEADLEDAGTKIAMGVFGLHGDVEPNRRVLQIGRKILPKALSKGLMSCVHECMSQKPEPLDPSQIF